MNMELLDHLLRGWPQVVDPRGYVPRGEVRGDCEVFARNHEERVLAVDDTGDFVVELLANPH